MAEFLNIRLTKDSPSLEEIDEAAAKYGMNRTEFVLNALDMSMNFDPGFIQKLQHYSKGLSIPVWLVMQNIVLCSLADKSSREDIYGKNPEVLMEFMFTEDGPVTGLKLFEEAVKAYRRKYGVEYVRALKENELKHKRPLDEHQKKMLEEFGGLV